MKCHSLEQRKCRVPRRVSLPDFRLRDGQATIRRDLANGQPWMATTDGQDG